SSLHLRTERQRIGIFRVPSVMETTISGDCACGGLDGLRKPTQLQLGSQLALCSTTHRPSKRSVIGKCGSAVALPISCWTTARRTEIVSSTVSPITSRGLLLGNQVSDRRARLPCKP